MNWKLKSTLGVFTLALASQAAAGITFYEGEGFRGRAFTTEKKVGNFVRQGFNDRASSVVVDRGGWEVCEDNHFMGRCVVLRTGSYESLRELGLENRISSVRPINKERHYDNEVAAPRIAPNYEYRWRPDERVFAAPVTSVHAVVGPPEQRCWMERQQVVEPAHRDRKTGGAVIGAIIGGILGHQVGGGSGKNLATVGGAATGALIGANAGRNSDNTTTERDVQRCETFPSGPPEFWDVTYHFRGVEHRLQMSAPPGPTIAVNRRGEPRQ